MIGILVGVIVGILSLSFLVAMHELGHAYAAIKNGVVVEEYAIGFPPAAIKFKKKTDWILPKGTTIAINWLPLGGYVKLQGEYDSDTGEGDYGAATFWGKTQILFAGVAMNWAISAVLFSVLAIFGLPQVIKNQFYLENDSVISGGEVIVGGLLEDGPAHKADLKYGDIIASLDGKTIAEIDDFSVSDKAGQTVEIGIVRYGEEISKKILVEEYNGRGRAGIHVEQNTKEVRATWSAPIVGAVTTVQFTAETFKGVGKMAVDFFGGLAQRFVPTEESQRSANEKLESASAGVAGPISIMGMLFPGAVASGAKTVVFLTAIISLSLACMNVLPIPALDGGRWLSTFVFRKILKKPLDKETEGKINAIGVIILMVLSLIVIVADIFKVF